MRYRRLAIIGFTSSIRLSLVSCFWFRSSSRPSKEWTFLLQRGGDDDSGAQVDDSSIQSENETVVESDTSEIDLKQTQIEKRHASDLILNLGVRQVSQELRQLIMIRTQEYLSELQTPAAKKKPHTPCKLLHVLAPKIPAIKHSPDVNLQIQSAAGDMDSGVASCLIGCLAHACEIHDIQLSQSTAENILSDRRFEQLVECVLCGVDVGRRRRQNLDQVLDETPEKIEDILEDAHLDDGLSVRDSCRAAWGLSILGAHNFAETLGGEKVMDLLMALSLRVRELLLARLQLLRQDDLVEEESSDQTAEERLDQLSTEIASDAASAMWSFACVRACTGMRSAPLFEVCCSILCQDPVDLRRRAQDPDEGLATIGTNDVVDRLARSESENADDPDPADDQSSDRETETKGALLDWLTPHEIIDALWALAVHGSSDSGTSGADITLSETASTLREIAFDRIVDQLREDLDRIRQPREETVSPIIDHGTINEDGHEEGTTFEVVDAATLLEAENLEHADLVGTCIENITVKTPEPDSLRQVQQVQVVDAAAVLAAERAQEGEALLDTELIVATPLTIDDTEQALMSGSNENAPVDSENAGAGAQVDRVGSETSPKEETIFSPRDLCSVAFSATELRDPLRFVIMEIITEIFSFSGEAYMGTLGGVDLANLAWAIVKSSKEEDMLVQNGVDAASVIRSIAQVGAQKVSAAERSSNEAAKDVFQVFQPPDISRLLWAVACTFSIHSERYRGRNESVESQLARTALLAASTDLSMFGIEDLVRIVWGFLDLCDTETALSEPSIAKSLGRTLATIESNLLQWERGQKTGTPEPQETDSINIFSSFFGRSRLSFSLLDQRIGDDDEDDDGASPPVVERSGLPLLRDLAVDPATLCKVACSLARLEAKHTHIRTSWTITRVAMRLLTSKNGRLLKECSVHDMIRMCEVCATIRISGHEKQIVSGLFVRRVLQLLNDANRSGDDSSSGDYLKLPEATPEELSTLLWSLGELGVRHSNYDDEKRTAYKKLRLVVEDPYLSETQVRSLSALSATKLLRGLICMHFESSDPNFLFEVLQDLQTRVGSIEKSSILCDLAESLGTLKLAIDTSGPRKRAEASTKTDFGAAGGDKANKTVNPIPEIEEEADASLSNSTQIDQIRDACNGLLVSVAEQAAKNTVYFEAGELRRLLMVYSLLPFQADALVDAIASDVSERQFALKSPLSNFVDEELSLSGDRADQSDPEVSRTEVLKKGIRHIFGNKDQTDGTEVAADDANPSLRSVSHPHLTKILQDTLEATELELGRCQELIANYGRIDFCTGLLRSRYDQERRKHVVKRSLSRLQLHSPVL